MENPKSMKKSESLTVVVVSLASPKPGSGGPDGFAYILLRALAEYKHEGLSVFSWTVNTCRLVPVETTIDVERYFCGPRRPSRKHQAAEVVRELFSRHSRYGFIGHGIVEWGREWTLAQNVRRMRGAFAEFVREHPRILMHAQGPEAAYAATQLCAPHPEVQLVHTEHSKGGFREIEQWSGPHIKSWRVARTIQKYYARSFARAERIVFPSRGAYSLFCEYSPLPDGVRKKVEIVYTGLCLPPAPPIPARSDIFRMFSIAEHFPEKGLDRLLRALGRLPREVGRNWRLEVAGGFTNLTPELTFLRNSLNLQSKVDFLGRLDHQATLEKLAAADLFVSFPRVIVFDLALLEAMAYGKPIITSSLTGNIEALGEDYPLYVSTEEDMSKAIYQCMNGDIPLEEISRTNCTRLKERFTDQEMATAYMELYKICFAVTGHRLPAAAEVEVSHG